MKKGLRNLVLGAAIAGASLSAAILVYDRNQAIQKGNFEQFFNALKRSTYAKYEYQRNPSEFNNSIYKMELLEYRRIKNGQKIGNLEKYFKDKGILCTEAKGSFYAAKIIKEEEISGTKVYFTKVKTNDFKGIPIFKSFLYQSGNSFTFEDIDGKNAINIGLSLIEENGKNLQKFWNIFKKNNEYFKNNDKKWDPRKQAIYNAFKDFPESEIVREYIKANITGTLAHEYQHIKDLNLGKEFSREDLETRAYMHQLIKSPVVLYELESIVIDNEPPEWKGFATKILNGLIKKNNKRSLYQKDMAEISKRAEELWNEWYPNEPLQFL